MKNYGLYIKKNHREVIKKVESNSKESAVIYFAGLKNLTIDNLLTLFNVKQIRNKV